MRRWERGLPYDHCGNCGARLDDYPMLVIDLPQLSPTRRRRLRCRACAGEEPDLEQLEAWDIAHEPPAPVVPVPAADPLAVPLPGLSTAELIRARLEQVIPELRDVKMQQAGDVDDDT